MAEQTEFIEHPKLGRPVAVYPYQRASRETAFVVCRFDPKDFRPAQQRNDRWVWNLENAPVLPYRLPELEQGLAAGELIWIVDGEKDADALMAAGACATCCARSQGWTLELAEQLTGARKVRIVADKDGGRGRQQALDVRELLIRAGAMASVDIEIVEAAEGKDAADHLAAGHETHQFVFVDDKDLGTEEHEDSWAPKDLNLLPETPPVKPDLAGTGLVYPGKRHVFSGPPESAKTLAAYTVLIENARHGQVGILMDFEMGPYDARQRLRDLGATRDEISCIRYLEPDEPATIERVAAIIQQHHPSLVVIDAAAGAYQLEGLDDNKRGDVERWARMYVGIFWRNGIATILIDHVVKNAELRGRFSIGSERKLGSSDVHLGFDIGTAAISRGTKGHYKIVCHKDRGGYHKRGRLADLHLDSDPETHRIAWRVTDPDTTADEGGAPRLTTWMEICSRELVEAGVELNQNEVHRRAPGNPQKQYIKSALTTLVDEGYASRRDEGNALLYASRRPYLQSEDPKINPIGTSVQEWYTSGTGTDTEGPVHRYTPSKEGVPTVPASEAGETDAKTNGWFNTEGQLAEAWYDDIAPDPDQIDFG